MNVFLASAKVIIIHVQTIDTKPNPNNKLICLNINDIAKIFEYIKITKFDSIPYESQSLLAQQPHNMIAL